MSSKLSDLILDVGVQLIPDYRGVNHEEFYAVVYEATENVTFLIVQLILTS